MFEQFHTKRSQDPLNFGKVCRAVELKNIVLCSSVRRALLGGAAKWRAGFRTDTLAALRHQSPLQQSAHGRITIVHPWLCVDNAHSASCQYSL
jgi:hypothetical protein